MKTNTRNRTIIWLSQKQRQFKSFKLGHVPYRNWVYSVGVRPPYIGGIYDRSDPLIINYIRQRLPNI